MAGFQRSRCHYNSGTRYGNVKREGRPPAPLPKLPLSTRLQVRTLLLPGRGNVRNLTKETPAPNDTFCGSLPAWSGGLRGDWSFLRGLDGEGGSVNDVAGISPSPPTPWRRHTKSQPFKRLSMSTIAKNMHARIGREPLANSVQQVQTGALEILCPHAADPQSRSTCTSRFSKTSREYRKSIPPHCDLKRATKSPQRVQGRRKVMRMAILFLHAANRNQLVGRCFRCPEPVP